MKKVIQVFATVIFNLALIFTSLAIPAIALASSPSFYEYEFEKNEIYGDAESGHANVFSGIGGNRYKSAVLTNAQLDEIALHIKNYLFGDRESFELRLDNVYVIKEGYSDGVSIFGEKAITHMEDVKLLIKIAIPITILSLVFIVLYLAYYVLKHKSLAVSPFKISAYFFAALFGFALLFVGYSFFSATRDVPFLLNLWKNLHYIIFLFQPQKVADSELSDVLTRILTTELFIDAVLAVLSVLAVSMTVWLIFAYLFEKKKKAALLEKK